ncbi:MAG: hypothetical protein AAF585_05895 [Verrucomicrobiota bacterium]
MFTLSKLAIATRLPFRLHQFFAQTGSVYATLDAPPDRHITLQPGLHFASEGEPEKYFFPHVFSRASGKTFICVYLHESENLHESESRLVPREFTETIPKEDGYRVGYIIPGGAEVWDPDNDQESVPSSWTRVAKGGATAFKKNFKDRAPKRISYDASGKFGDSGDFPMKGSIGCSMATRRRFRSTSQDTKTSQRH